MKALIAKLPIPKAIGLYLGDQEIAISQVASTALGFVETARCREPCRPEEQEAVLERLLRPLTMSTWRPGRRKRWRMPIAVGLPAGKFFFVTRPLRDVGAETTAEALLQKVLHSPNICVDDFNVDMLKSQWNKVPIASLAACRRKPLVEVLATLERFAVRPLRVEPDCLALVRTAAQRHRLPRKAKTVLHVFLNKTQGLAVLAAGALPIAWRKFALPAGREGPEIFSVQRTLQALERHYGAEAPLDTVAIYGRGDLHARLQEETSYEGSHHSLCCHQDPGMDGTEIAFGLALGCLQTNQAAFDVSRALKPRPSIREIFPWGEMVFEVAMVICLGLFLAGRKAALADLRQAVLAEKARHACLASTPPAKLEKEKNELREKVDAVRGFLASRILWSAYTHDLPTRLPDNARFVSLQGLCPMEKKGGKPKKSLNLLVSAPMGSKDKTPQEIDDFVNALRNDPLLKNDFPDILLNDIKGTQGGASFSLVCLPGTKTPPANPKP